ncbi:protein-L-isoaspartate(D-aspartate) O-methyltransferase [Candidatus Thorarchaeota archaeon]|jgi:protein-L-isoaspartate(D-aspartate) O-methyltransferase|nr:MAG: protein-L-isoaspartate(D-aspartate) O-methyltransferase [Candidatus Thorarchaeota archaeon]
MPETQFREEAEKLAKRLRRNGYLKTEEVERAFKTVPREEFVPPPYRKHAYRDTPLSIGLGQTISAPHMCVIMCEGLKLEPGHKLLEIGAGSGYHAALCAEIVAPKGSETKGHVHTVEIVEGLIETAREALKRTGYADHVTLVHGDGGKGLPEEAPFNRVLVTAAAPSVPQPLIDQLEPDGIMIIPVGSRGFFQNLFIITKNKDGSIERRNWGGVAFVPLTGDFG